MNSKDLNANFLRIPAEHQIQIGGGLRHERVQGPTGAPLDGQSDPKRCTGENGLPWYRQLISSVQTI